ncbi:MAG: hypothetical protein M3Y59_00055, partial [Myxococcota bacterium]|nr:hypothetical protein [Myxococcota bacterium]
MRVTPNLRQSMVLWKAEQLSQSGQAVEGKRFGFSARSDFEARAAARPDAEPVELTERQKRLEELLERLNKLIEKFMALIDGRDEAAPASGAPPGSGGAASGAGGGSGPA